MSRIGGFINYAVLLGGNAYPTHLTLSSASAGLPSIPAGVNAATLRAIGTGSTPIAYYRLDGEVPTSTQGIPLYVGDVLTIYSPAISNFRIIGTGSLAVEYAKA